MNDLLALDLCSSLSSIVVDHISLLGYFFPFGAESGRS